MKVLIISKDLNETKTARYLKRFDGLNWYFCASERQRANANWPSNTIFYNSEEEGANIAHGNALRLGDIVLDDDYGSLIAGGKSIKPELNPYFMDDLYTAFKMAEETGFVVGGYSGGAMNEGWIKNNIMQVFVNGRINKYFRTDSRIYRYNDDVCACIMATLRGDLPLGVYAIRSGNQTGELIDNTNEYTDWSWSKSFMSVMYAPAYCKVNLWDIKRRPRWHHQVQWHKMRPKILIVDK